MKFLLTGLFLLLMSIQSAGQQEDNDLTLHERLKNSKLDSTRVAILLEICQSHLGKNLDSAFKYAVEARDVSRSIDHLENEAYSVLNMGRSYGYAGEIEEAKKHYREAARLFTEFGDELEATDTQFETGVDYLFAAQYDSSLTYLMTALPVYERHQDTSRLGKIYNNMAIVYRRIGFFNEATQFYRKSYDLRKATGDRGGMATTLLNIGVLHFHQEKYDSSLSVLEEALVLAEEQDKRDIMALSLMNKAANLQRLGAHEASIEPAHEAAALMGEIGDDHNLRLAYSTLGNAHGNLGNCDSAMHYIALGEYGGLPTDYRMVRLNYKTKALCAEAAGDFENAFAFKALELAYQDSVAQESQRERVATMQIKYEQEVRKKDLLQKEKRVAEAEADRSRANTVAAAASAIALFLVLIFSLFYFRSKRRRDRLKAVTEQHISEIEYLQGRVADLADAPQPAREPKLSPEEVNQYLVSPLTSRELEVLSLISEGKSNQQIADETFVSINTIKTHVNHIYEKLDVKNRTQATMKASELNLLETEKV